jgi:hypothetical protein
LTLTLKPRARGNWSPITLTVTGQRALPLLFQRGQTLTLGGLVWRICKVAA